MDEQTIRIIEAFAKMKASNDDPDEIMLAQRKVRTPEGVKKYDQPIGTIITKDMIEKAAKKATEAATKSLHSDINKSSGAASSSGSTNLPNKPSTPKVSAPSGNLAQPKQAPITGVPGGQTKNDIDAFYVSSFVNDPSKATMGWVQKKDGQWYTQTYENGQVKTEVLATSGQVNALQAMEAKGLVHSSHIPDAEPVSTESDLTSKIQDHFANGKTPYDPEVKTLLQKLQKLSDKVDSLESKDSSPAKKETSKPETDTKPAEKSTSKTVKINGKDVKVGRYSRPKGFAKAFLIVHEDGTIEYEDKTGKRKKITAKSFESHQSLGMNKFLTESTDPIKKDSHFQDGKLVSDKTSAQEPSSAKVEPVTPIGSKTPDKPASEVKPQEAAKPAQKQADIPAWEKDLIDSSKSAEAKKEQPKVAPVSKPEEGQPDTVKIGNLTVKVGRYSRPKGFAKAFLIVHPDGTAEYENKNGDRKKIGPKSFEGHWKLGMNKFLTSDTGAIKKGDSYENGKLVESKNAPEAPKAPESPKASPAIDAAKKAAIELKAKQDAKKAEEDKSKNTKTVSIEGKEKGTFSEDAVVYYGKNATPETAMYKYVQEKDGQWFYVDKGSNTLLNSDWAKSELDKKKANGDILPEGDAPSNKSEDKTIKVFTSSFADSDVEHTVPKGSKFYVTGNNKNKQDIAVLYVQYPDKSWHTLSSSGEKPLKQQTAELLEHYIGTGTYAEWEPKDVTPVDDSVKTFNVSLNSANGGTNKDFPEGSSVYVAKNASPDLASTAYVVTPDGTMWRLGAATGIKEVTGNEKDARLEQIGAGTLTKWVKYHSVAEQKSDKSLYVKIGSDSKFGPFPDGTKVFYSAVTAPENSGVKYLQDPDTKEWTVVSKLGSKKASNYMTSEIESAIGNGGLVEDKSDTKLVHVPNEASVGPNETDAEKAAQEVINAPKSTESPKSVKISGMDVKPGKYSIGKEFAKAFLEVHGDGSVYYVNKKGDKKKLTAAAFKKNWDAGMKVYSGPVESAAGPAQSAEKTKVGGPATGSYYFHSFDAPFDSAHTVEVLPDGSGLLKTTGKDAIPVDAEAVLSTFSTGWVTDEFGNTVVIPGGGKPSGYHLFAGPNKVSAEQLQELRNDLTSEEYGSLTKLKKLTGQINVDFLVDYAEKYFPNTSGSARKSMIKAIDDLLHGVTTKQADKPSVEAVPNAAKAAFGKDSQGYYIMPELSQEESQNFHWGSSSEQNAMIKKVASQVGNGKVIGQSPSKLNSYKKTDWMSAFQAGNMKQLYQIETYAGMPVDDKTHPGSPLNKDTHQIIWAAAVPGELPAGKIPEGKWSPDGYKMSDAEIDNYILAANMAYPEYLDSSDKKYWVHYHMNGSKLQADVLSLKAKKRHDKDPSALYSSKPKFTPNVKPYQPHDEYYKAGGSAHSWPQEALKSYAAEFPDSVPESMKNGYVYDWATPINSHMENRKAEEAAKAAAELAEAMKPKFTLESGKTVTSTHEAMVLSDQFGKKWIYKPRQDKDIFLADVEQAAHELSSAWGFKTAKSHITEFDNRKGHVQQMLDAEKDFTKASVTDLNTAQIQDLAKEHLLDWALDNDDGHAANLLILKNGSVVGIDKGRAFVGIGHWDGLTGDSKADSRANLVYTKLYDAIANKSISQEDANAAYFSVLKQARKMSKISDSKMTEILERGFANRKVWGFGGPSNKEDAIQRALDRKNSLVDDMEKLWGNVFKRAGYTKPQPPENIVVNDDDQEIHLGITPAALEQAKANGSYGASVFFGGPEIEDAHVLLYHAKSKTGQDTLHGEMKIREETKAFKDVEKWLKDNAVQVGNAYGFTPSSMKVELPNEGDYYQQIIAGVKTISHHALDGQYNEGKLNGMSFVKNTLQNYINDYDAKMADPTQNAALAKQYKDPKAFLEMAQTYLGYIKKAEEHKKNGTKSSPGEFERFVYTPPKEDKPESTDGVGVKVELRQASSPKAVKNGVPQFDEDGQLHHKFGYDENGNPGSMYLVTLPTGETIEFRGNTTGTPAASKGLTRFTMPAGAEEAASLERIRAQMAEMGLSMNEANEDDLELYYWRHLAGIMAARADSKDNYPAQTKSTSKYNKFKAAKPVETANMTPAEEIEAWRNAFANITSREQIDEFVGSGGHLPKFGHFHMADQNKYSGQPYWERFDVTDEEAQSKQLLAGSFYQDEAAQYTVTTGGMLSTEARLRTLGMWKDGMSSSADQSHGSSGFVFIRQNQEVSASTNSYGLMGVYYNPKILKRTHNYSYAGDNYGNIKSKPEEAYFDFDALSKHSGSGNEIMIKHAVSTLDDIEIVTFTDEVLRNKVIKMLKDMGVDEIRGVPVEQRFVMRNKNDIMAAQKAAKEAWSK